MRNQNRTRIVSILVASCLVMVARPHDATSQPRKPRYATTADLERLEKKVDEQQAVLAQLIKLQQQYLQAMLAIVNPGNGPAPTMAVTPPAMEPAPSDVKPIATPAVVVRQPPQKTMDRPAEKPSNPKAMGSIIGKVKGASDAIVYVDISGELARGTAQMKQEGKQFVPRVMVVQKGTRLEFPNMDAVFHNVFSVTPDNSFDLGSYRQGESKSVTVVKTGVVTVYCNMHPQMVGHVLVVPSKHHVRAGQDGFFKIPNVPVGRHKIVAWAPNAKPVTTEVEVADSESSTVELQIGGRASIVHTNKEGLPYGSYKD